MERARDILRSGAWLTRERVRLVAAAVLIASVAGFVFLVATAHGCIDVKGRPIGTDFSNVYAAGTYALEARPDAAFDASLQHEREQKLFGTATPFYGWHYPPFFLLIAAALALLPYGAALAVWQAVTLALYLLAMRGIFFSSGQAAAAPFPQRGEGVQGSQSSSDNPHPTALRAVGLCRNGRGADCLWLLVVVAFPAVLINIGHGQNGFLTAALVATALIKLDRAPLVAGILFGLLAYKPQFGLMVPIVLAASGRWRVFAAAAATVAVLAAATTLLFGPHVWQASLSSLRFVRVAALEQGGVGFYKIQSLFAWARMWGAPVPLAYALQAALAAGLTAALVRLWRSSASYPLKAAALCVAALLATPYTFDYDMMLLAPAIAFFAADGCARGFGPWEKTALAALWLMPLLARSVAHVALIPLGVPAMLAIFILLLRRSPFQFASPVAFSRAFLLK